MHRRSRIRRSVLGACVATAIGACSMSTGSEPTPVAEEHMPRYASVQVRGHPEVATIAIGLEIWVPDQPDAPLRSTMFPPNTIIRWDEGLSEGPIRLVASGVVCARELVLPPERSTIVSLRHDGASCSFELRPDAPDDDDGRHLSILVTALPWDGVLVEAISLDSPAQPVPEPAPPDEGGLALMFLHAGRYEIRLRRGDAVLERHEVEVEPAVGGDFDRVELVLDGVQG